MRTIWEHRVQIAGEERPPSCWPSFAQLSDAEEFVKQLQGTGVRVIAIHSHALAQTNAPGPKGLS